MFNYSNIDKVIDLHSQILIKKKALLRALFYI